MQCIFCGEEIILQFDPNTNNRLASERRCFNCDFWARVVAQYELGDVFSTGDVIYRAGSKRLLTEQEKRSRGYVGFNGQAFHVKMNNGEEYDTNDLWSRGEIPDEWKQYLPQNAELRSI